MFRRWIQLLVSAELARSKPTRARNFTLSGDRSWSPDRPRSSRRAVPLAVCVLAVCGFGYSRPVGASRQFHTEAGVPMRWSASAMARPLPYSIDVTGLEADGLTPDAVMAAVESAFATWQSVTCPTCDTNSQSALCGQPTCEERRPVVRFACLGWQPARPPGLRCASGASDPCLRFEPDGNQVTFVHDVDDWSYGRWMLAMTVVSARADTGEIEDADIVLNDAGFVFCIDDCATGEVNLSAVIQHEAGHFLGLDHSDLPTAVMAAKPPASIGALQSLTPDDVEGVCAIYRPVVEAAPCPAPRVTAPGNCALGGPIGSWHVLLVAVLIAGGVRRARRAPRPLLNA